MQDFLLAVELLILFILIFIIHRLGPSEESKVKHFKKLIRKEYDVDAHFIKRTNKLGDNYYVFNEGQIYYTVSENGIISNLKL